LQTRQWSNKVIRTVIRKDWKVKGGNITRQSQVMVLPRVVEEVRRHFGCDDLEGAELEDQGEEGTAMTHWEKRVFEVSFILLLQNLNTNYNNAHYILKEKLILISNVHHFILFSERSYDGNSHSKSSVFTYDPCPHGGHWLVQS
jgi:hypothetical protein